MHAAAQHFKSFFCAAAFISTAQKYGNKIGYLAITYVPGAGANIG